MHNFSLKKFIFIKNKLKPKFKLKSGFIKTRRKLAYDNLIKFYDLRSKYVETY